MYQKIYRKGLVKKITFKICFSHLFYLPQLKPVLQLILHGYTNIFVWLYLGFTTPIFPCMQLMAVYNYTHACTKKQMSLKRRNSQCETT